MSFDSPEWLLLIALYGLLGWQFPNLKLWRPMRLICGAMVILSLMDPRLRLKKEGVDLFVLADRSESARDWSESRLDEWEAILESSKGEGDRLRFIDFAAEARLRSQKEAGDVLDERERSRVGLALRQVLLSRSEERPTKALLLSDGYSTDDALALEGPLLEGGVVVDYRLAPHSSRLDLRVSDIRMPMRVRANESFLVDAKVEGNFDGEVMYQVFRDGNLLASGKEQIKGGSLDLRFADRISRASATAYTVSISAEGDEIAGNNMKTKWVQVEGGQRVMLLSNFREDPLGQALRAAGFDVEILNTFSNLNVGSLSGISVLILNNIPANRLPSEFMKAVDFFVRNQGGGLMMVGGRYSFGSGGYYGSAIQDLIPVSMELKEEHKKLAVAMSIVVDRSGSMSAGVPGMAGMTKMDLANAGAAQATALLGELDAISYLAVDTNPHLMVPLTEVGPNRESIIMRIRRVASMGGGIYVYEGLKAGWEQLQRSQHGQRHLVLFSDSRDTEEPGEYEKLIEEMVANKTTISVIAMGDPGDVHADLLRDIAERGKGRIFFNSNPEDLPALFSQETVAVARSAFIEDPIATVPTAGWLEVAQQQLNWLNLVEGYNLSYLQQGATMALASNDEYKAPLVAYWQKGIGRAAAVTFPLAGDKAVVSLAWPEYGDFCQTLTRWLAGDRQVEGVSYESRIEGDRLSLDLYYGDQWEERFNRNGPQVWLSEGDDVLEAVWERIEPGRYRLSRDLRVNSPIRAAIQLGDRAIPMGPFFVGTDEEWQREAQKIRDIRLLSKKTGGKELANLTDVWEHPPSFQFVSLRNWALLALFVAFVLDVAITRTGGTRVLWRKPER
ncbi:MAG: VWA domain-containing protein [Verrucomicrobiota bacterium]